MDYCKKHLNTSNQNNNLPLNSPQISKTPKDETNDTEYCFSPTKMGKS